jgi:hypothetical protein
MNRAQTSYEKHGQLGIAFWLTRDELYEVETTHVRFILNHPELFGTTREELLTAYRHYGEKIGFEGRARRAIIRNAVEKGWIRIRHYIRPGDYWTIQRNETDESLQAVAGFITFARGRCGMRADDVIVENGATPKHYRNHHDFSQS